jgi:diguanylate cyclase (GGDEF)-like protein
METDLARRRRDQRRHTRQPMARVASLMVPGVGKLACELRDACPGGFYLSPRPTESKWPQLLQTDPDAELELVIEQPGEKGSHRMLGRIAHRSAQGAGFACHREISPEILSALQFPEADPARPSRKPQHQALHQDCLHAYANWLPDFLDRFSGRLVEELGNAADRAPTNQDRYDFLEALADFKSREASMKASFMARLNEQASRFADPPDTIGKTASQSGELTLLDQTDFEDWLALNHEVARLEADWQASLDRFNPRLSVIAGKRIGARNNPFGPWMLGQALKTCLDTMALKPKIKHLAYHAFAQSLSSGLEGLYAQLDGTLQALAPAVATQVHASRRAASQVEPAPPPVATAAETPLPDSPPAPAATSAAPSGVLHAARSLLSLEGMLRPAVATPAHAPQGSGGDMARLADALPAAPGAAENVHAALFQSMLSQSMLPPALETRFASLQAPLSAAAAADPQALERQGHPVREFVNLLEHLAIATDERGQIEIPSLATAVDRILQKVTRSAAAQPEVFEEAREALSQLTGPLVRKRAARVQRLQQTCEASQRLEVARRAVDQAIASNLEGRAVPTVVPDLFHAGWRQLLVLTALREGVDSPIWRRHWSVIEALIAWLAPGLSSRPASIQAGYRLINQVEERLWDIGEDDMARKRVIEDLTALLVGTGPDQIRAVPRHEVFVSERMEPQALEPTDAERDLLERLRVGDWLSFATEEGDWSPQRLSWIGQDKPLLVFSDQKGNKTREIAPRELAELFQQQRAHPTQSLDQPWLDRTTNELMERLQERLRYQATHDPASGLVNHKEFVRQLEHHLSPHDGVMPRLALCFLEVELLQVIHTLCGLEACDHVLKDITRSMAATLRTRDLLARLGDSHFGVLLVDCDETEGQTRAEELLARIREHHFQSEQHSFTLGGEIGIACCDPMRDTAHTLIQRADAACQAARKRGRNQIQFYREHDAALETHISLISWAGQIDKLLAEDRLFARAQPIVPLFPEREAHSHHEILLGIRDESGNATSPLEFVRAAEHWKRMPDIDRWQVESVFRWIGQNRERFDCLGGFAINLSGQSINDAEFLENLQDLLFKTDWPRAKITFEITETAALDGFGQAQKFISQIKRLGCKFSLDDFGSGFSSYAYLKNLNVDYLKIDGSFVKELATSKTDFVMVKSMNEIGHSLSLKTIAEYVENEDIAAKLREVGVDFAQGYGVGKPVPLEQLV